LILFTIPLFLAAAVTADVQSPIFSEDKNPSFSSIYHVDSVSNTTRDADFTLRVNRNAPFNCTKDGCPASVIINNKTGAVNMVTPVKVNSLYVGDRQVIDASGAWRGDPTGLKGENGKDGTNGKDGASCKIDGADLVCGDTRKPLSELKGADGRNGIDGINGESCKIIESDIVCADTRKPLSDLKGADGRNGADGKNGADGRNGIDGRNGESCKIVGTDIVCADTTKPLSDLKGADGRNGVDGRNGIDGKNGESCNIVGSDIVCADTKRPLSDLKGADGRNGTDGLNGSDGRNGIDGKNGESCKIVGQEIICGDTKRPLSDLKGADGRNGTDGRNGVNGKNGESCVVGASIYPACLDSLINQNLFKMIYSETASQECQFASVGFQKKFTSTCPTSHPNAIGGGCEMRNLVSDVNLTSSEALRTGKGWQCELITADRQLCDAVTLRVWTTCSRMAIDYSEVQ